MDGFNNYDLRLRETMPTLEAVCIEFMPVFEYDLPMVIKFMTLIDTGTR